MAIVLNQTPEMEDVPQCASDNLHEARLRKQIATKEREEQKNQRKIKQIQKKKEREERKASKAKAREEREERKEIKAKAREDKKRRREEGKTEWREKKKPRLEEGKTEWREKKKPRLEEAEDTIELGTVWPVEIQRLYVDGNNMMFMTQLLRQLTLNGTRHMTEIALCEIARLLQVKLGIPFVQVVFDKSTHQLEQSYAVSRCHESFMISSSRPTFATADDELVQIASQVKQSDGTFSLFVTSDRELRQRLMQENGKIIGPKKFLQFVFESLNTEGVHENVDGLIQQIIETPY
jgi:hypothetical protein